jgi:hypothetical protein
VTTDTKCPGLPTGCVAGIPGIAWHSGPRGNAPTCNRLIAARIPTLGLATAPGHHSHVQRHYAMASKTGLEHINFIGCCWRTAADHQV